MACRQKHCDVKPDNWLLVKSRDDTATDLMLIDFGRSVDLESVAPPGTSPYDVRLAGDASRTEMKCVAMRQGLTWSFDVDTYGICASAHVLLFAEHMELILSRSSKGGGSNDQRRWMPAQLVRKNHHRLVFHDLWQHMFATLLNVDDATLRAIDSRPASLRMLRSQVAEQLEAHRDELGSALRHQASILLAAAATESGAA